MTNRKVSLYILGCSHQGRYGKGMLTPMEEIRNMHKTWFEKPKGKRHLTRNRHIWEDNTIRSIMTPFPDCFRPLKQPEWYS
jgi:hypothetical protein